MYIIQFLDNGEVYGKCGSWLPDLTEQFFYEYGSIYHYNYEDQTFYDEHKNKVAKVISLYKLEDVR